MWTVIVGIWVNLWHSYIKRAAAPVLLVACIGIAFWAWTHIRLFDELRESNAHLALQLARSHETIELESGLRAKLTEQIGGLQSALQNERAISERLLKQLAQTKERIVTVNTVEIRWRDRVVTVPGIETPVDPAEPGDPTRTRVDFTAELGMFAVDGHTLTSPPEATVKLRQVRPLSLTLAVARGPDGGWTTYVDPSEDDVDVDVTLSGVDLGPVLGRSRRSRVELGLDVGFIGSRRIGGRLGYDLGRWTPSIGCSTGAGGTSCGASLEVRPFR